MSVYYFHNLTRFVRFLTCTANEGVFGAEHYAFGVMPVVNAPAYHGPVSIEDVIDEAGVSMRDDFLLECCYAMEALTGPCEKVTLPWWNSDERLWNIRERFIEAGIFVDDADVFNKDDIENLRLIDFRAV